MNVGRVRIGSETSGVFTVINMTGGILTDSGSTGSTRIGFNTAADRSTPGGNGELIMSGLAIWNQTGGNFFLGYQGNGVLKMSNNAALNDTGTGAFHIGSGGGENGGSGFLGNATGVATLLDSSTINLAGDMEVGTINGGNSASGSLTLGSTTTTDAPIVTVHSLVVGDRGIPGAAQPAAPAAW